MELKSKTTKFFYSKLPVIVRNDIDYQIKMRMGRANCNAANMEAFQDNLIKNALKAAPIIEEKFVFSNMVKGVSLGPMFGLDHYILMDDKALDSLSKNIADTNAGLLYAQAEIDGLEGETMLTRLQSIFLSMSKNLSKVFITTPKIKRKHTIEADAEKELEIAILRCICEKWILRKFLFLRTQYVEFAQIALGRVGKKTNQKKYVSAISFAAWKEKQKEAAAFLEKMAVYCEETGENFNLEDVVKKTTANPENRRIEMMVRSRGNEERAIDLDYIGVFITWTLPSKYHPSSKKWNGSTIKEGHNVIMEKWGRARARIAKDEIDYFGFRVAEPHKDGCEHSHIFLFCSNDNKDALIRHIREVAIEEDREELGCDISPRFEVKLCDPAKGGATAYIAKYISKNINGAHMPENEAEEEAFRVRAWASTHRIRQFQEFGSPSVGLWRQLRRASEADTVFCEKLETLRRAADSSRWKEFCELAFPAKVLYEEGLGVYGEVTRKTIGFSWFGRDVLTATKKFMIIAKAKLASLLGSGSALGSMECSSWSTENNCNHDLENALMQLIGWSRRGVQCLIKPLLNGRTVWIDRFLGISIIRGELRTQQRC